MAVLDYRGLQEGTRELIASSGGVNLYNNKDRPRTS